MEFKEFEPRFKSAKTRFKLSAGINLETFDIFIWLVCRLFVSNKRENGLAQSFKTFGI